MKIDTFRSTTKFCAAALGLAVVLCTGVSRADDPPQDARPPFAVLSIASIDRLLDDLEFVLESAGQAERMSHLRNILIALNDLDGLDRDRPLGLLLSLPTSPPHEGQTVAFLPVTGLDRLNDSLRLTETLSIDREADSGRFRLTTPDKTHAGLLCGDWIFLAEDESLLSEQLVDSLEATPIDVDRHDAVLTLRRDGIPEVILEEALARLHADLERDLEPREEETSVEHQLRSRVSRGIVELIERFLTDADDMTISLDLSEVAEQAQLQVRLNTRRGSPLSRLLRGLTRPDSQFSAITRETAPLTIATTWRLEGEPADIAGQLLAHVRGEVSRSIEQPQEQLGPHPFERILTSLSETIDAGRLDALVQFLDAPDGRFVLVAAAHVEQADSVDIALREILRHHASSNPESGGLVEIDAFDVGGVALHRVRGANVRRQDRRLYGDDVAFFVGAGREAVWLAMGGGHTESALRRVILAAPAAGRPDTGEPLPLFKGSLHLANWVALAGAGETERERKLAEAARIAFRSSDDDGVHVELFADETGLLLNVRADRGYIRLLGVALAARMSN